MSNIKHLLENGLLADVTILGLYLFPGGWSGCERGGSGEQKG